MPAQEAVAAVGQVWLVLTAWIALPWAVAVVVVTWHRRGPRIPARVAAGAVLAVLVILAGAPTAAVMATDTPASAGAAPESSQPEPEPAFNETEDDGTVLAQRGTYEFNRGELACGPVERRPGTVDGVENATRGYEPAALHNVSEPVAVAPLLYEGEPVLDGRKWSVDLGLPFQQPVDTGDYLNGSVQPAEISYGAYTGTGETADEYWWMLGEEVNFRAANRSQLHVYWDVVHPNGTVHRYATKLCLPADAR